MQVVEYQTILHDLFPSIESLTQKPSYQWLNTIEVRKLIIYGREKSGKTELARKLSEMLSSDTVLKTVTSSSVETPTN